MSKQTRPAMIILALVCTTASWANQWSETAEVRHDLKRCVGYRARLAGEFLVVEATHEPGWHTNAMDNKQRAEAKLAGRQSLGVDAPTEITLAEGLQAAGPWYQTPPKDFSKPELEWFTWGFDSRALFVAKVRRSGTGPARIAIAGQACTDAICKKIDLEISLPLTGAATKAGASDIDWKALVQVRQGK